MTGTCKCGNEPSGSVKCGEFLDQLRIGSRRTLLHGVSKYVRSTPVLNLVIIFHINSLTETFRRADFPLKEENYVDDMRIHYF